MSKTTIKQAGRAKIGLLGEIGFLMVALTATLVVLVQSVALMVISKSMTDDLRKEAARTTEEAVAILEVPLYILDSDQCNRIGRTLLASGRISGIRIVSSYSDVILDVADSDPGATIESTTGEIMRNGISLGSYRLDFSDRQIRDMNARIMNVFFWVIVTIVISITATIRLILVRRFVRAFSPINRAFASIEGGEYGVRIPESKYADIDRMVENINRMAGEIEKNSNSLRRANQTLEQKVEARTAELRKSLDDLGHAQERLVHSEKMSALGGLSAGIAHELNTPLGAILSSNRVLLDFLDKGLPETLKAFSALDGEGRGRFLEICEIARDSAGKQDLSISTRKQRKLAEDELLARGVEKPDEVAELLVEMGIRGNLSRLGEWLGESGAAGVLRNAEPVTAARRMAEVIEIAGGKAANVVAALRSYLTPDDAKQSGIIDLEAEIEKMLTLMQNILKHGITIERDYAGVMVRGSAESLGQVWLNLIRNAAQAMDFKGTLTISTSIAEDGRVTVSIGDTGTGIAPENRDKIFEPFFSTKKYGEGMGIGLDICKRITEGHGGTIGFESEPGNTVFTVILPEGRKKGTGE